MEPVLNSHHLITKCHFINGSGMPLPTYLPTYQGRMAQQAGVIHRASSSRGMRRAKAFSGSRLTYSRQQQQQSSPGTG